MRPVHEPLPWERVLWRCRPLARPWTVYALTDFRLLATRARHVAEVALQDIAEVEQTRSALDRLLGTSTLTARSRDGQRPPVVFRHIRQGAQLAALIELLAGDPRASLDPAAVKAALSWDPRSTGPHWRKGAAAAAVLSVALLAAAIELRPTAASIVYAPDDAIYPNGRKRDQQQIVQFMESEVMPWAREALGPIKGGADQVTCATCHGIDPQGADWQMPGVAALPEPHFRMLGWEIYSAGMNAQMRNAIYGYVAEPENQSRAAYMRKVVLPGIARLLNRPAYDFTRSYEYNRTRAAFGCYHCHKVR
jgi:hypothetical protein